MSVLPEILGTPHPFEHKGKTYQVKLVDQNAKAAYELYLFDRAKQALKSSRDMYTQREYDRARDRIQSDYISGKYAFLSKRGGGSLRTPQGVCKLLSLLFGVGEQEMWQLIAERNEDLTALLDVIMRESFPEVAGKVKKGGKAEAGAEAESPQKKGVEAPAPAGPTTSS